MQSMANPHPIHMALSARAFASKQNPSARSYIQNSEDFDPRQFNPARSSGKLTMGSNVFQFYNTQIAEERGRPNALGKETLGTVYGGRVGEF